MLASCLTGAAWWLTTRNQSSTGADLSNHTSSCLRSEQTPHDHCERVAANIARRTPLSPEQRAVAERAYNAVQRAVSHDTRCSPPSADACLAPTKQAPKSADVDHRRESLEKAGFADSAVRIARADDPAPQGSLLYAVPVANGACVVGYIKALPGGGGGGFLGGLLHNGRCLDD